MRLPCLLTAMALLGAPAVGADDGFDAAVRSAMSGIRAPAIDAAEARRLIREENAIVLDARTAEEFRVSHLESARFLVFGWWQALFGARLPEDLSRERPVVVYCTVGWRSGKVTAALAAAGHSRVFNLTGGILAWHRAGLPLVDATGAPTRAVHPYNAGWARFVR